MLRKQDIQNELELLEDETSNLGLAEALAELLSGGIVLVEKYERTREKDVLVKLDDRGVTLISYETEPKGDGGLDSRHWQIFNVSLNTLSLKKVHRYDEGLLRESNQFRAGDIVEYEHDNGREDIAVVDAVYRYQDQYLYQLSGEDEDRLFEEPDASPYNPHKLLA